MYFAPNFNSDSVANCLAVVPNAGMAKERWFLTCENVPPPIIFNVLLFIYFFTNTQSY